MKNCLNLLIVPFIMGCVSNGSPLGVDEGTPEIAIQLTEKMFIGIPVLLSAEGSSVKLGNGWSITAAHNKPILELTLKSAIYHPYCDVAIFKGDPNQTTKLGVVYPTETTYTVGYPIALPIKSSKGFYVGDVMEPNKSCLYSATSSTVNSGLSGGGVWDEDGNLVGIIRGVMRTTLVWEDGRVIKNPTVFTSLNLIKDWLYIHTGLMLKEK